jgi:WD40 repeat protein
MIIAAFVRHNELQITNTITGTIVSSEQEDIEFYYPQFSPDGSILAAKSDDERLHLWDTNTVELIGVIGDCQGFAFSPGDEIAIVGSEDIRIQSIDGTVRVRTPVDDGFLVRYSVDGSRIIVLFAFSILRVYDTNDLTELMWTRVGDELYDFNLTSSGDYIVVNTLISGIRYYFILNAHNLTVHSFGRNGDLYSSMCYPIGNSYIVSVQDHYEVQNIDTGERKGLDGIPIRSRVRAFSPDGRYAIVSGEGDSRTVLVNLESGDESVLYDVMYAPVIYQESIVLM